MLGAIYVEKARRKSVVGTEGVTSSSSNREELQYTMYLLLIEPKLPSEPV